VLIMVCAQKMVSANVGRTRRTATTVEPSAMAVERVGRQDRARRGATTAILSGTIVFATASGQGSSVIAPAPASWSLEFRVCVPGMAHA